MFREVIHSTVGDKEISLLQLGRELFLIIVTIFLAGFLVWLELEFGLTDIL